MKTMSKAKAISDPDLELSKPSLDKEDLVKKVVDAVQDLSTTDMEKLKSLVSVKEIIGAIVFISTLIGGGYVAYEELKAKPTKEEVFTAIESRVQPLEDAIEKNQTTVNSLVKKVDRLELAMDLILDEVGYQSEILACQSDRNCKTPPAKPYSIEAKRRKLLLGREDVE
jgi:hypothetical protein